MVLEEIDSIGVGAGKIWGAKDFCPNFPKLYRKIFRSLIVRIFSHEDRFWDDLQKKVLHVILGTVFSNQSTLGAIILPAFSGT